MNSVLNGATPKIMAGKMHEMKHASKDICLSILKMKVIVVFLEMLP